jgi:adhesin transport system outer membrane protein
MVRTSWKGFFLHKSHFIQDLFLRFASMTKSFASKFLYAFLAVIIASPLYSSLAHAQSMDEAVKLTVENNPQIGSVSANRKAVEQELRQARGLYLPQVDVVTGVGPEWTSDETTRELGNGNDTYIHTDARVSVTEKVFNGFQTENEIERQKARVASAANRVYQNAESIALDAIGAYLEVIRQRELFALAKQNIDFHTDILGKLDQRAQSGVGTTADVAQTRARLARSQATLVSTSNDLGNAEALYTRVIGQHPGELTRPAFPAQSLPQTMDDAVKLADHNPAAIKAAESDVKTTSSEIALSNGGFLPTVNIEADAGYDNDVDGENSYGKDARILLRGRWNLFRGGIDRAARQEAVFRMHQAREDRARAVNEQVEEARRSWYSYQASAQRVGQLRSAVEDLKNTRAAYQQQFEVGSRTLLDLLDAENELFTARGQLISADIDQLVSGYRLLATTGTLLTAMNVAAPSTANPKSESFSQSMALE